MQDAVDAGRTIFDFGHSSPGDGTYDFKEQWGGIPEQLWWEYACLVRSAFHPSIGRTIVLPPHRILEEAAGSVATLIGPRIARLLP